MWSLSHGIKWPRHILTSVMNGFISIITDKELMRNVNKKAFKMLGKNTQERNLKLWTNISLKLISVLGELYLFTFSNCTFFSVSQL
jgi:hypothetical protein